MERALAGFVVGGACAAILQHWAGNSPQALLAAGCLVAGGLLSGFMAGLLGIGGALITVPVLYLALPHLGVAAGLLAQTVVATALVAMVPTTVAAARSHARHGALDWAWIRRLVPTMTAGAAGGAVLAIHLPGRVLALAFAAQSLFYGAGLVLGGSRDEPGAIGRRLAALPAGLAAPAMAAFCACVGMGGGSMVTPYLRARGLRLHHAVATASTLNLCIAIGGSIAFALSAATEQPASACWPAGLVVGLLAVVAVPKGVAVAHRMSVRSFGTGVGAINIAGAMALFAQAVAAPAPPPPAPAPAQAQTAAIDAPAATLAAGAQAAFRRLVLHALLVPLLDEQDPPSWAMPNALTPCQEGTSVTVDGAPIVYGAPIPSVPFRLSFRFSDCWPLEALGRLDGSLQMIVTPWPDRLAADVEPDAVVLTAQGVRVSGMRPFRAELSLVGPARRP